MEDVDTTWNTHYTRCNIQYSGVYTSSSTSIYYGVIRTGTSMYQRVIGITYGILTITHKFLQDTEM